MAGSNRRGPDRAELAARIPHRVTLYRWLGRVFQGGSTAAAAGVLLLAVAIAGLLGAYALPSFRQFGVGFLTSSSWSPVVGAGPAIVGTLLTSALALLLGVPVALGVALFTSEVAPRRWRGPLAYVVDLGAMVPSVVYGFWGLIVLVPFMGRRVEPVLSRYAGASGLFGGFPLGVGILTAGVILAIMVIPTIAALSREALRAVPRERRESALGIGATRWEATRIAVLPPAAPGILGAVVLGLGRALGETIAVILVIGGGNYRLPTSLLSQGYTIPSLIAGRFDGASGLGLNALFELGLILFVVSLAINVGARTFLARSEGDGPARRWFRRRIAGPHVAGARGPLTTERVQAPPWWPRVVAGRDARILRRRIVHWAMVVLLAGSVVVAVYPLVSLARVAVENGGGVITHLSFYTQPLPPQCDQNCSLGGVAPAIQGTFLLVGLAALIGVPIGILAGIYLSEYGRNRFGRAVGLVVDAMVGIPSILVGIFVFAMLFQYDRIYVNSALAGGIALSVLMIPIVTRTTDTALRTVPASIRESAMALGFPRHRITLRIVLGTSRSAIVTGCLLALGRIAGETAALLFTVGGGTSSGFTGWNQSVTALAPFIYEALENQGTPNWVTDAWGAALLLLLIMLGVTLAARLALRTEAATGAE